MRCFSGLHLVQLKITELIFFLGTGVLEFKQFCSLAARFLTEELDDEAMLAELKEAFRLYDREGT